MTFKWIPALLSLALSVFAGTAFAATCGPRAQVVERLASTYGETVQSMGLGSNNGIVEVFASTESGTWTITVTTANGRMCLVASGQAFEAIATATPTGGEDA